jgi:hypothetical protein
MVLILVMYLLGRRALQYVVSKENDVHSVTWIVVVGLRGGKDITSARIRLKYVSTCVINRRMTSPLLNTTICTLECGSFHDTCYVGQFNAYLRRHLMQLRETSILTTFISSIYR